MTKAAVEVAGELDSVLGQQALTLAGRMASMQETGAAVASLSRQLSAIMAEIQSHSTTVANPLDELRARRDRKRAAG